MLPFAVILNAASGPQELQKKVANLRAAFASRGVEPEVILAHDEIALREGAVKAFTDGYPLVVAAGGDGTVSAVAGAALSENGILGILPLGTLNHFARDLGIPLELEGAIDVLLQGQVIAVDAARVNGRVFINTSSLGLYAKWARYRDAERRRGRNKWVSFFHGIYEVMRRYSFFHAKVAVNGVEREFKTPLIFIGNNRYELKGMELGARKRLDEGTLSIGVATHSSRWGLVRLAWHVFLGKAAEHRDFDMYHAERITIDASRKFLHVSLDGEVVTLIPPLRYEILPRALRVMRPHL
jgi:YegS/Rv2252/BmrU family lipid kinase